MTVTIPPSTSTASSSDDNVVTLPAVILCECVAPFIGDRKTWNSLVAVNKEMYQWSLHLPTSSAVTPPWPQVRWSILAGPAWSVAFGHGFLACGTAQGKIQVWNSRDGTNSILRDEHPNQARVHSLFVIRNLLVSCSEDGKVLIWRNQEWTKCYSFAIATNSMKASKSVRCCCAWLDDETAVVRFAAAGGDLKIYTFRVLDHQPGGRIEFIKDQEIQTIHNGPILSICKIGHFLVSGGSDESLLAWDILDTDLQDQDKPQPYRMSLPNVGMIRSLDVCNNVLAVACGKNMILYNQTLQRINVVKGYHGNIRCVTFSSDGTLLASAYNDGIVCVWRVQDGVCVAKWQGHGGFLVCAINFQGSNNLVSVGSDGTVAIWDVSRYC